MSVSLVVIARLILTDTHRRGGLTFLVRVRPGSVPLNVGRVIDANSVHRHEATGICLEPFLSNADVGRTCLAPPR